MSSSELSLHNNQVTRAIFNRTHIRKNKEKATAINIQELFDWTTDQLLARLSLVKRSFTTIVECGGSRDHLVEKLQLHHPVHTYFHIEDIPSVQKKSPSPSSLPTILKADEEYLPFNSQSIDLYIGHLTWHFLNDLPGFLKQAIFALKPDGLLLGVMFGEHTLCELAHCFFEAQQELYGGITPLTAPFVTSQQIGGLLQRAGFTLPVVDRQTIHLHYSSLKDILKDIQSFGGQARLYQTQNRLFTKGFFQKTEDIYQKLYATKDHKLRLTLDFLFISGWRSENA